MKRSKLFLGVTASLLGVAALAASKAKFHSAKIYYTANKSIAGCVAVTGSAVAYTTAGGVGSTRLKITDAGSTYFAYLSSKCTVPLYVGNQ